MSEQPHIDMDALDEILERYPKEEASLIQVLQDVHRTYNFLPCDALYKVAEVLGVPLAKVFSVSTFYRAFSLEPQGKVIIKVCTGTACHIRGAGQLIDELKKQINIGPGETTEDLGFTIKTVNCVGACAMAPVMIVGDTYHGNAARSKVAKYIESGGNNEN